MNNQMYLAAYHVDMPWEKSRAEGQGDFFIQFLTNKISHPEVVDYNMVLNDACNRIPHLGNFIATLLTPDPSEPDGKMPKITYSCCSSIDEEQAQDEGLDATHYVLGILYGDGGEEDEWDDVERYMLPDKAMTNT